MAEKIKLQKVKEGFKASVSIVRTIGESYFQTYFSSIGSDKEEAKENLMALVAASCVFVKSQVEKHLCLECDLETLVAESNG